MSRELEYTYKFVDGNSVTLTARGDCADERELISEKAFVEGYTPKEIAEMTGVTERRIKQIRAQVGEKIKKYLIFVSFSDSAMDYL